MKKKLISLICAASMACSALVGFSLIDASAEGEPTIKGTVDYVSETKTAQIKVSYEGMPENATVDTVGVFLHIDPEIFEQPQADEYGDLQGIVMDSAITGSGVAVTQNMDAKDNNYKLGISIANDKRYLTGSAHDIYTITLAVKDESKLPATLELSGVEVRDCNPDNMVDGKIVSWGTSPVFQQIKVINPVVTDPNAPTAEPTNAPTDVTPKPTPVKPTEKPGEPTATPEITDPKIEGTATYDKDTKTAVIKVAYGNLPENATVDTVGVFLHIDPEIFEQPQADEYGDLQGIVMDSAITGSGVAVTQNMDAKDNNYKLGISIANDKRYLTGSAHDIYTITLAVKDESKLPATLELSGVEVRDCNPANMVDGKIVSWGTSPVFQQIAVINPVVKVEDVPGESPTPTPTAKPPVKAPVKLDDVVGGSDKAAKDIEDFEKANEGKDPVINVDVTFKDSNGADVNAKYGDDYVLKYNGKELSEYAYESALQGDFGPLQEETGASNVKWTDFFKNSEFDIYNSNIAKVDSEIRGYKTENGVTSGEVLGGGNTDTKDPTTGETPTPTPTATPSTTPSNNPSYPTNNPNNQGGNNWGWNGSGSGSGNSSGNIYGGPITGQQGGVSGTPFQDVDAAHAWAVPAINALYQAGIIEGRTSTLYDPDATVTRAEFTKMVVGASGLAASGTPSFPDAQGHWAAGFIATAEKYGIVTGYTADQFAPEKPINRQEMAAIVYRAATAINKAMPAGSLSFADADQIDDYAKAPVAALQAKGVIQGVGNNMFDPKGNATRAQSAVIVYNYMTK